MTTERLAEEAWKAYEALPWHSKLRLNVGQTALDRWLLEWQVNTLQQQLADAEKALAAERASRVWAFDQLRGWWQGIPRDMSNPVAAFTELRRHEAALDALSAGEQAGKPKERRDIEGEPGYRGGAF